MRFPEVYLFIYFLQPIQDIRRFFQPTLAKPAASDSAIKKGERKKSLPSDEDAKKKKTKAGDSQDAVTVFPPLSQFTNKIILWLTGFRQNSPNPMRKTRMG